MAGMPIGFRVDNAEVLELFARAPTAVKRRLTQLVEGGAIDVQREMRQQAPVAVTGYLRRPCSTASHRASSRRSSSRRPSTPRRRGARAAPRQRR